jgi:hypothetical protein
MNVQKSGRSSRVQCAGDMEDAMRIASSNCEESDG